MTTLEERIKLALELLEYLTDPLPVGSELRDQAVQFCSNRKLNNAAHCSRELYNLGRGESNAYVQGYACFLLGAIFFALGESISDLDKSIEYFEKSVHLFHTFGVNRRLQLEGIAWFFIGEVYEEQCSRQKYRHSESIGAYKRAHNLLKERFHELEPRAEVAQRRMTQKMADWLKVKKHAEGFASTPRHVDEPNPEEKGHEEPQDPFDKPIRTPEPDRAKGETNRASWSIFFLLGILIIVVAPLAAVFFGGLLLSSYEMIVFPFLCGYSIAVLLILALGVFWVLLGHLRYKIPASQAAIIEFPDRIWELDGPGVIWQVPPIQVQAFVLLQKSTVWVFVREFSTPNGFTPTIRTMVEYRVKDGVIAWRGMATNIQRSQFLGFTRPATVEQTTKYVEQQVQQLVRQVLKETAYDPARQDLFKDKKQIKTFVLDRLNELSDHYGVAFSRLDMEVHLRDI